MQFKRRRIINSILLLVCATLVIIGFRTLSLSLIIQQYISGWFLFSGIAFLLLYKLKKKLSIIPLGSNSIWMQMHYYTALLVLVLFLVHVDYSLPNGFIEITMTALFALIIISGIFGWVINRLFAWRLAQLPEEILYDRIPFHLQHLNEKVRQCVLDCVKASDSSTLANYYLNHLEDFFTKPRYLWSHVVGTAYQYDKIILDIQSQLRYLNQHEITYALQLEQFVREKSTLDNHYALQTILKYWGLLHFPVTLLLLITIFIHIVLVYAFRGVV